jgi:apolipoprotein N-acyltransferase
MEKRARLNRIFGIALLAAALVVMGWQLALIYISGMRHVLHGLLLILAVCGPLALGTHLLARSFSAEADRRRAVRTALFVLFGFYCATLVGALIVSRVDALHFAESRADYWDNFDLMTNFRPV